MTQQFYSYSLPQRNENICLYKDLYTRVHSSFIHHCQKLERAQISISWCVDKQIVTYPSTMKYYSAMRRNKLPVHATASMSLKIFVLNERNQTQRRIYCMIPFIQSCRKCKLIYNDKKQIGACLEPGPEGNLGKWWRCSVFGMSWPFYRCKPIKTPWLYILNGCSLLHVNYISINLLSILARRKTDRQG